MWRSVVPTKGSDCSLAGTEIGNVIATGGVTTSSGHLAKAESYVELYDSRDKSQWIPLPVLPRPRYAHASCYLRDSSIGLVLAGGHKYQTGESVGVQWVDIIQDPFRGAS